MAHARLAVNSTGKIERCPTNVKLERRGERDDHSKRSEERKLGQLQEIEIGKLDTATAIKHSHLYSCACSCVCVLIKYEPINFMTVQLLFLYSTRFLLTKLLLSMLRSLYNNLNIQYAF